MNFLEAVLAGRTVTAVTPDADKEWFTVWLTGNGNGDVIDLRLSLDQLERYFPSIALEEGMSVDLAAALYQFAQDWDARKPVHDRGEPRSWEELTDEERKFWWETAVEVKARIRRRS